MGTRLACGAAALVAGWPIGSAVAADEHPQGHQAAHASASAAERRSSGHGAGDAAPGSSSGAAAWKQAENEHRKAEKKAEKKAEQAEKADQKAKAKAGQADDKPQKKAQQPTQASDTQQSGSGNGPRGGAPKAGDPHGNNGTVKIAPLGELDRIPNNTPHPGCTFQVEWYGFDGGSEVVSTVTFGMMAPTGETVLSVDGPTHVPVGGDAASGAGTETGLDARQPYTLSFTGEPHPKQGYHVRLTVQTPRSLGNDTKTKVFWVEPCVSAATFTPQTGAPGTMPGTPAPLVMGEPGGTSTSLTQAVAGTSARLEGAGVDSATGADVPTSVAAGTEESWRESQGTWSLLSLGLLGAGLVAGAAGLLVRARRRA